MAGDSVGWGQRRCSGRFFRQLLIFRLITRGLIRLRRAGSTSSAISASRSSYQRRRPARLLRHSGRRQRRTFSVPVNENYAAADGTAKTGTDYTAASATLAFAPGVASQTFTVPILTDGGPTGQSTVYLSLTDATNSASLGGQATTVLTLNDLQLTGLAISAPRSGVEGAYLNGDDTIANIAQFTDPGGAELISGGPTRTIMWRWSTGATARPARDLSS